MRHCGDVIKAVRYLSLEIRGIVWSAEIHVRETDIKKILKTMGMAGNTQEVQKSRG